MAGGSFFIQIAVDQYPEGSFQAVLCGGFLEGKKGCLRCTAGLAQGGGGVFGVQIRGYGKNYRDNIRFRQRILTEQIIIKIGYLPDYIFIIVDTPDCSPEGKKPLPFAHILFPPAATKIKTAKAATVKPNIVKAMYIPRPPKNRYFR
jgi:hypothetical protein